MKLTRVLLADDHAIVREGLRRVLEPDVEIVAEVADGRAMVAAAERLRPDVVICDISMPLLNGIDAARHIRKIDRKVKIIFLTMHCDVTYAAEAFRAGGAAYVLKSSAGTEIREAIRETASGGKYVSPAIDKEAVLIQIARASHGNRLSLTDRQREVLQLIGEGRNTKETATILHLSPRTVEFHKSSMMRVLGLRTTAELVRYAVDHGIAAG